MTERISQDTALMLMAMVTARRGTCSRAQVGVVIAVDGRAVSTGYNGAPAGMDHCVHEADEKCNLAVHAEANAIAYAARHGVAIDDADLFTTFSPCLPCSQLIINAGIVRVVYSNRYRLTDGLDLLEEAGVLIEELPIDMMEA